MSLWRRIDGQAATAERAMTGDLVRTAGKVLADLQPVGTAVKVASAVPAMTGARERIAATAAKGARSG
jgi:hypothetical protein